MYFQMASISHVSGLVARKNRLLSGVTAARPQEDRR
jgi:tetrahydromethanopterin S-methyltransferase subunit F